MVWDLVALAGGLTLLVFAVDHFVEGAARLANSLPISPLVVGAVIMGFGTSVPELLVSGLAAHQGDLGLGVGNVVGSNVANLSLVMAAAALLTTMTIPTSVFRREAALAVIATVAFSAVVIDGVITRWEGGLLVSGVLAAVVFLLVSGRDGESNDEVAPTSKKSADFFRLVLGLGGTLLAAQYVIQGANGLAVAWGLTGGFIGFSLVALGTSLPELVTTVACARRGETELIVGNLFGSNIFNSLAVGGAIGLVGAGPIGDPTLTGRGVFLMLLVSGVAVVLARQGHLMGRKDGAVLLALYFTTMIILGVDAGGGVI